MKVAASTLRFGCGRCGQLPSEHLVGRCPDGGGSYTFVLSAAAIAWLRENPDVPRNQLASRYADHLRRGQSVPVEGTSDEAPIGEVLGACPACRQELRVGALLDPLSGLVERALLHPVPFCTYFGETDSSEILAEVKGRPL